MQSSAGCRHGKIYLITGREKGQTCGNQAWLRYGPAAEPGFCWNGMSGGWRHSASGNNPEHFPSLLDGAAWLLHRIEHRNCEMSAITFRILLWEQFFALNDSNFQSLQKIGSIVAVRISSGE